MHLLCKQQEKAAKLEDKTPKITVKHQSPNNRTLLGLHCSHPKRQACLSWPSPWHLTGCKYSRCYMYLSVNCKYLVLLLPSILKSFDQLKQKTRVFYIYFLEDFTAVNSHNALEQHSWKHSRCSNTHHPFLIQYVYPCFRAIKLHPLFPPTRFPTWT